MAVQNTYLDRMPVAYAGMIATTVPNTLVSYQAEAAIGFGRAVKQGTADNEVDLADNASDDVIGIAVIDQSVDNETADTYPVGGSVNVLTIGEVYVTAGGTATAGTQVYMVPANGKFVSSSTDNLLIPGATFTESGADTDLVKIRVK